MATPPLLRTHEAAKYLSLGIPTLEKLRVYGGGPNFVRLGRSVRYRPADLDAWLESRIYSSTSDRRQPQKEARHER